MSTKKGGRTRTAPPPIQLNLKPRPSAPPPPRPALQPVRRLVDILASGFVGDAAIEVYPPIVGDDDRDVGIYQLRVMKPRDEEPCIEARYWVDRTWTFFQQRGWDNLGNDIREGDFRLVELFYPARIILPDDIIEGEVSEDGGDPIPGACADDPGARRPS